MQLGITSQHHKSSLIGQNCLSFLKGLLSKLKITTRARLLKSPLANTCMKEDRRCHGNLLIRTIGTRETTTTRILPPNAPSGRRAV